MRLLNTLALLFLVSPSSCFVCKSLLPCNDATYSVQTRMNLNNGVTSRRNLMKKFSIGALSILFIPPESNASVYFEIDRYGDKELKKGTVSKIRQAWRNKMLEDPTLAPQILRLAINDALGYDVRSTTGGPDGSVSLEMSREENKGLENALKASFNVMANLKRTSEVSLSDVIAFGGGEAIEATGGPRVVVQLGRYDEKKNANPAVEIPGYSYVMPTGDGIKAAFKRSGLGSREAVVLLGALGTISDIALEAAAEIKEEEDDDLVDSKWEKSLLRSFGEQSEIYGEKVGKANFNTDYFKKLLKYEKKPSQLQLMDKVLVQDPEFRSLVLKYASNEKAFAADLAEAYNKLTLLGEKYENRIQSRD